MWEKATFQPVTINWWVEAIKWVIYGWKLRLLVSVSPTPWPLFLACSGDLRLQGMKKEPVKNLRCLSFWCCISSVWTATTLGQDNTSAKIISLIPTNESLLSPPIQFTLYYTCWWCWSFQSASHQYSQFLKQTDKESHFTRPECFSPNYTPLWPID